MVCYDMLCENECQCNDTKFVMRQNEWRTNRAGPRQSFGVILGSSAKLHVPVVPGDVGLYVTRDEAKKDSFENAMRHTHFGDTLPPSTSFSVAGYYFVDFIRTVR